MHQPAARHEPVARATFAARGHSKPPRCDEGTTRVPSPSSPCSSYLASKSTLPTQASAGVAAVAAPLFAPRPWKDREALREVLAPTPGPSPETPTPDGTPYLTLALAGHGGGGRLQRKPTAQLPQCARSATPLPCGCAHARQVPCRHHYRHLGLELPHRYRPARASQTTQTTPARQADSQTSQTGHTGHTGHTG